MDPKERYKLLLKALEHMKLASLSLEHADLLELSWTYDAATVKVEEELEQCIFIAPSALGFELGG